MGVISHMLGLAHILDQVDHLPERPKHFRKIAITLFFCGRGQAASIMASATPFCFCTTQKHLTVKRSRSSMA
jgi:hypothetical protein